MIMVFALIMFCPVIFAVVKHCGEAVAGERMHTQVQAIVVYYHSGVS